MTSSAFAQSTHLDTQRLFQQALAAQQRGDDATALTLYRQLLQTRPQEIAIRVNLGATYAHMKRFPEAIEQYRIVLAADSQNHQVRINLALAYQENGRLAQAAQQLEFVHRALPSNPQAAVLLGDCYSRLGRYSDAVAVLTPLETSLPGDLDVAWLLGSALIRSGRQQDGLQRIDKVAEKTPSAEAYLLTGRTRLELTQYDLARRDADAARYLNPGLAGLQTLDGMLLEQTGNYTAAEVELRGALQADPQDFDAHFYLGAILYFNRHIEEARQQLEKALQLRPASLQAGYELALVLRAEGELDRASNLLERIVRENPDWLQPHIEMSALYYQMHRPAEAAAQRQIVDRLLATQFTPASEPMP